MPPSLSQWLEQHDDDLIRAAALALTTDERLRQTVEISIIAFYQGVQFWAQKRDFSKLRTVLVDWVSSRSLETGSDETSMIPILITIKRVTWRTVIETAMLEQAILFLDDLEALFNEATSEINRLETEQLLSNSVREADEAKAMVKRLDKSKSDFIAVAAHELKTPLTLIEGYITMIRNSLQVQGQDLALTMLSGMQGGAGRLREIIEDMIAVSLIDMKTLELHNQPVWINRLVDIVGLDLAATLRDRNIRLEVRKAELPEHPTFADSERLYQVIQKVISNAIKYTPDGGTITVGARALPGFTDVQIGDTGIGIAPESLSRIFEKFSSQGAVATHSSGKVKFKGGGPGLGLAIAKGIMEAHGGSIWAESPGYDEKTCPGSTFHIMVPMRVAPADSPLASLFKTDQKKEQKDANPYPTLAP